MSRIRATHRAELKKKTKILRQDIKTKSLSEYILNKIIAKEGQSTKLSSHMECGNLNGDQSTKSTKTNASIPTNTDSTSAHEIRSSKRLVSLSYESLPYEAPTNGTHYTIREAFIILATISNNGDKMSGIQFLRENTLPNCIPVKPRVLFEKSTLYRHLKIYKTSGELPPQELDGARVGRPPYISSSNIDILNKTIRDHPGHVQRKVGLDKSIKNISRQWSRWEF